MTRERKVDSCGFQPNASKYKCTREYGHEGEHIDSGVSVSFDTLGRPTREGNVVIKSSAADMAVSSVLPGVAPEVQPEPECEKPKRYALTALGTYLRLCRIRAKRTLEADSKAVGRSRTLLGRFELGHVVPLPCTRDRLAKLNGVDASKLRMLNEMDFEAISASDVLDMYRSDPLAVMAIERVKTSMASLSAVGVCRPSYELVRPDDGDEPPVVVDNTESTQLELNLDVAEEKFVSSAELGALECIQEEKHPAAGVGSDPFIDYLLAAHKLFGMPSTHEKRVQWLSGISLIYSFRD